MLVLALAAVTAINLRGIAHSARAFVVPTVIYVGAIVAVIVVGVLRDSPAVTPEAEGVDPAPGSGWSLPA